VRVRSLALGALLLPAALGASPATAAAARPPARSITLAWVGDMTLGSSYGDPPHHARGVFAAVRRVLAATDLTTGNLEGTFGSGGASKCGGSAPNCFAFQAPAANAGALRSGGFDVVNVANNHALDFGLSGQRQTLAALRGARVAWTGRPGEIRRLRVHGIRVALVGFAPYGWAAPLRAGPAARLVRRARRHADVVVAFMHAGAEGADRIHTPRHAETYLGEFRGDVRPFAHRLVAAGADLVLGSGPHVLRGLERYRGRLIAYSLGNFLGWHNFGLGGNLSLSGILRVRVSRRGRLERAALSSVRLAGPGRPVFDRGDAARRLVIRVSREDFGRRAAFPHRRLRAPRR
jgi:Bacterial capsule synthesis protein PGA_cap